ncbi:hypothetical protein AK830_g3100 [Neonectria ditissima]|uniref:Uncharacterized protein n=1 Tax=Neonectria ditissima TaxID=78410 RepID=A0A0N8H830_9HYPO|nr:hypothetical protein AK830_g3100 [Neonectria ditissima]
MSKQANQEGPDDEDAPPPYSPSSPSSQFIPSLFSSHLDTLHSRILSARAARTSERDERDSQTLATLVPHVESLLQTITNMDPPPRLMEMTLVPEDAVGEDWKFNDEDASRTIVRVHDDLKTKAKGDHKDTAKPVEPPRERAFDDWGRWEDAGSSSSDAKREVLWWSDDEMASRLAKYLQPERPRRTEQPAPVAPPPPVEPKQSRVWGLLRRVELVPPAPPPQPSRAHRTEEDDFSITVRAEEVTFRRENSFGIWESKTGWGLVVRVRIRR